MEASSATNAALRARLSELMDEYDRMRADLAEAQRRMRSMRGRASSGDGTVTAIVDFRGNLLTLELSPRAYSRFSPTLLAEEIVRLVNQARAEVTSEMEDVMAPFLPDGVDYAGLMDGSVDPSEIGFPQPLDNENYDEWRARFSGGASR